VPVDRHLVRRNAEDGDPAAVVHHREHVAEGLAVPRHLHAHVEALGHPEALHDVPQRLAAHVHRASRAQLPRELEPVWVHGGPSPCGLTPVPAPRRAPTCFEMAAAITPMGPAPVMRTSSPTRSKESAVCTAFPSGSKNEAISSGIPFGTRKTLNAGRDTYSAKQPGRLTPRPTVFRHRWRFPARQFRQWPQVMCPSPLTRSPTSKPVTSAPSLAISPMNSCPITIGTLMVFCAHASQFQM